MLEYKKKFGGGGSDFIITTPYAYTQTGKITGPFSILSRENIYRVWSRMSYELKIVVAALVPTFGTSKVVHVSASLYTCVSFKCYNIHTFIKHKKSDMFQPQ